MSGQLKYLRGRIKTLKSTTKITKAMQLVSSSKYRTCARKIDNANNYLHDIESLWSKIQSSDKLSDIDCKTNNLLYGHEDSDAILLIAFSANRGLCGGINTHLQKFVSNEINATVSKNITILAVGKKIYEYLVRKYSTLNIIQCENDYVSQIHKIIENNTFCEISIAYTHFHSVISYKPTIIRKFPLCNKNKDVIAVDKNSDYILVEPNKVLAISMYVNLLFTSTLTLCHLHSDTSENAGRMIAMDNATKNGNEIMQNVTRLSNKIRQANVTRDLIDIVSGAQVVG